MKKTIIRPFSLKSVNDDGTFEGHASVFGEIDSYRDIVMPGAFTKSLAEFKAKGRHVPMLWQHNARQPIGIYPIIGEDDIGLKVRGECNMDVQQGRECYALMKQGALTGLSIGYDTIADQWDAEKDVRKLLEVDLWEISPVTFPAGDSARVTSVKSIEGFTTLSECEELLRDAGLSRKEALAFIAKTKAIATQSDSAADEHAESVKKALQILRNNNIR